MMVQKVQKRKKYSVFCYTVWGILFSGLLLIICLNFIYKAKGDYTIKRVVKPLIHGEALHWDPKRKALFYVDSVKAKIIRLKDGEMTQHNVEQSDIVSSITPIANTENKFLLTCDTTVRILDWDGYNNTGEVNYFRPVIADLEPAKPKNQANNGKADASGQFWTGTLTRNDDGLVTETGGTLYLIRSNGAVEIKLNNITISTGITWNKENTKFFYISNSLRNIEVFDYNLKKETIRNRNRLFSLDDLSDIPMDATAGGMTIDSDDNLWVAVYGGSAVLQIDSKNGKLLRKIDMPVSHVTSVAFGGKNLDVLYVASSRFLFNNTALEEQPQAGSTYTVTGLGVIGVPMNEFIYEGEL